MPELYPWHQFHWNTLMAARAARRMPHALLLVGPVGMGKRAFASKLSQALSCEQPQENGHNCGSCSGCYLQQAGSHPDHITLLPEEGKQAISVEQVRQIHDRLALKAKKSRFKTVIIFPTEGMTLNAANSLLKVLEEPPGETVIILISSAFSQLPITIRSRCQRLWFTPPQRQEAQIWLQRHLSPPPQDLDLMNLLALVGGAPLRALEYIERGFLSRRKLFIKNLFFLVQEKSDPLDIVQNCLKDELGEPLYWMSTLIGDMIRLKSGVSVQFLINFDVADSLQLFAQKTQFKMLFALLEKIERDLWLLKGQIGINPQLLLEKLLIDWLLCFNEAHCEYT
jgi:DNA polymerase-3 subunit delta'